MDRYRAILWLWHGTRVCHCERKLPERCKSGLSSYHWWCCALADWRSNSQRVEGERIKIKKANNGEVGSWDESAGRASQIRTSHRSIAVLSLYQKGTRSRTQALHSRHNYVLYITPWGKNFCTAYYLKQEKRKKNRQSCFPDVGYSNYLIRFPAFPAHLLEIKHPGSFFHFDRAAVRKRRELRPVHYQAVMDVMASSTKASS